MMQRSEPGSRALAAMLIICAMAVGALGGIAFDRMVLLPRSGHAGEVTPAIDAARPAPGGLRGDAEGAPLAGRPSGERYLRHLASELELTEQQRLRLEEILGDQQQRVMEITRESRPRIRAVAEDTREAIREVLTPEQWARFQEMRQHRDRRNGPPAWNRGGERMRDTAPAMSTPGP